MIDPKTLDKESLYLLQIKTLHQGKKQERQRIIKLLEGLAYIDEAGHEMIGEFKSDLIALIKGEQK